MEKNIFEDGTYKFIYKLPSDSILEFDFAFKKGENFETVMSENFEQEQIPKIFLSDIYKVIERFLYEEQKTKKIFSKNLRETMDSKFFPQEVNNKWLSEKTFKNHIELNSNNSKHITQTWQKLAIINFFQRLDGFSEFENNFKFHYDAFISENESVENELRNKQEREMQEANIKNLPLDLIVNRHILELNTFTKEKEERLIIFTSNWQESFIKLIDQEFHFFIESIDSSNLIYSNENKLIQIKAPIKSGIKRTESSNENKSDIKSIKSTKSKEKINIVQEECLKNLILQNKINFGLFNKNKLNIFFQQVQCHFMNNIKSDHEKYFSSAHHHKNIEDYTINDILKSSDIFGDHPYAMINFFHYDKTENKIFHQFDTLNSPFSTFHKEFYYDSFLKFFSRIENACKNGNLPQDYDIFITKHSSLSSFNLLLNVFLNKAGNYSEDSLNKAIKSIIYFSNVYKLNTLIIPLETFTDIFFKVHKFSDMKIFIKCTKIIVSIIRNTISSLIKSGMKIFLRNIVFTISNSFILGFDKSKTYEEFKAKFASQYQK